MGGTIGTGGNSQPSLSGVGQRNGSRHLSRSNQLDMSPPGPHIGPEQCQTRNGNSIQLPSSRDIVLVDKLAVHSTLVVLSVPSVLVIVFQNSLHGVGDEVSQVTPLGRLKDTVPPEEDVMEQIHPSGQTTPVGTLRLQMESAR